MAYPTWEMVFHYIKHQTRKKELKMSSLVVYFDGMSICWWRNWDETLFLSFLSTKWSRRRNQVLQSVELFIRHRFSFVLLFSFLLVKLLYFLTNELQLLCHVHYVSNLKIVSVLSLILNSYFKKLNSELCNPNGWRCTFYLICSCFMLG